MSLDSEHQGVLERVARRLGHSNVLRVRSLVAWSWSRRATVFSGVFATVWLFLEPLSVMSRLNRALSGYTYLLMIVISAGTAIGAELVHRMKEWELVERVQVTLVLTRSGRRIKVEVPLDLSAAAFVQGVLDQLAKRYVVDSQFFPLYDLNLIAKLGGEFVKIPNSMTLREAGITTGTECRLLGYIRVEYYTLGAGNGGHDWMIVLDMRKRGKVVFDEDCSTVLGKVVNRRGNRRGITGTVYVIDNAAAFSPPGDQRAQPHDVTARLARAGFRPAQTQ